MYHSKDKIQEKNMSHN